MPIETRTIIFDQEELVSAAYAYCSRQETKPPPGRLISVVPGTANMDNVRLRFTGDGDGFRELDLTYIEMAAALILHCRTSGVPLPRYGRKRLTPAGEGMALMIRMPEFGGSAIVETKRGDIPLATI